MKPLFRAFLLGTAVTMAGTVPAAAQYRDDYYRESYNQQIDFNYFYDQLAPYGRWIHTSRWGDVWQPDAGHDFRPYYYGRWDNTREYGWYWDSDEDFGDITYHYGRWVYDRYYGWLWLPGYVWGPAWVIWRSGGDVTGWAPMPPDEDFLYGYDESYNDWNDDDYYGYGNWYGPGAATFFVNLFVFVGNDHFADDDCYRYARPQRFYNTYLQETRNVTNYVTINNFIVNRSIDPRNIERASHRPIVDVPARSVINPQAVVLPADMGRKLQLNDRRSNPIDFGKGGGDRSGRSFGPGSDNPLGPRGDAFNTLAHRVQHPQGPNVPGLGQRFDQPGAPDRNWRRRFQDFQKGEGGLSTPNYTPPTSPSDNRDWRHRDRPSSPGRGFEGPASGGNMGATPLPPSNDRRDWHHRDDGASMSGERNIPPNGATNNATMPTPSDNRDWRHRDHGPRTDDAIRARSGGSVYAPETGPSDNRDWRRPDRSMPLGADTHSPRGGAAPTEPAMAPRDTPNSRVRERGAAPAPVDKLEDRAHRHRDEQEPPGQQ